MVGLDPAAIVNPARSAVDAVVKCFGPDHVAVALHHRMSTAEFDGLFGIESGMDAAEDHRGTALSGDLADLIAAQRITCMNANAEHIACTDTGWIEPLQSLIANDRVPERRGRGRRKDVEPAGRDYRRSERHIARV